jgi:wyosine [tRNA(Phe)-imidazoG37] synthetase (radical SAM superfamily)
MSIVFGPIPSRRLGRSLGINNIPPKQCSYSCVYCQVGLTTHLSIRRKKYYAPSKIYSEVKNRLDTLKNNNERIDYLSFVPDGEPTLDINLQKTISQLQGFGIEVAVFTNSSLMFNEEVRIALNLADYISVKVDAADDITWRKINRPNSLLKLKEIQKGILEFSKGYRGKLVTETMLIDGINDNEDDLVKISHFISQIKPSIAYLMTPTRPTPIRGICGPGQAKINSAFELMKSINSQTELLNQYEGNDFGVGDQVKADLLSILAVHPMRKDAVEEFIKKAGADYSLISSLIESKAISEILYNDNLYYTKNLKKVRKEKNIH